MIEPGWIRIPGGRYKIGTPQETTETVLHRWKAREVKISTFFMADCSVTVGQFSAFLKDTQDPIAAHFGHLSQLTDHAPACGITWYDAQAYIQWFRKKTGTACRLPTSEEWEAAARGGLHGKKFSWGDEEPSGRCNCFGREQDGPLPVRSFAPNGYGLYDMTGGVWNWCSDLWVESVPYDPPVNIPTGMNPEQNRVLRGGSFMTRSIGYLMCACVHEDPPDLRHISIGMRLVCDNV